MSIRVTVWNENRAKETTQKMYEVYPKGIHGRLKEIFENAGFSVTTALLDDPDCGLPDEVLDHTDVLVYWSHLAQDEVPDTLAEKIAERVNQGMGFIPLHSAHMCKPFVRLMGTTCTLNWRESSDTEILWTISPGHPIAEGVAPYLEFSPEEMYGEYFDIPAPDETVFISWFSGGEVFRSGVCYHRGRGRIFYFQPGHETFPTYDRPEIEKILVNAVKWAAPPYLEERLRTCRHVEPLIPAARENPGEKMKELLGILYTGDNYRLAVGLLAELLDQWKSHANTNRRPLNQRDCMLITYGDGITEQGEDPLRTLSRFMEKYCGEEITNVHLLPVFPYTSDDGFSVSDYRNISEELGNWEEVRQLGSRAGIMMDAVINHTSKSHPWFRKCCAGEFPYTDYYIECDEHGDYSKVTRPRALPLLTEFETAKGKKWYWTTFSEDQVDLNFGCPYLLKEILEVLLFYASQGARFIRLDAIGFAWKKLGTTCMHLKETHALIKLMRLVLSEIFPGTYIITETNVPHMENISYFGKGDEADLVYQFPLPPLVLYTMLAGNTEKLCRWAKSLEQTPLPPKASFFNFLASHDGIGVRPVDGILNEEERQVLFSAVEQRGGRISYKQNADGSKSPYELNINYLDALTDPQEPDDGIRTARFLASQAIMLSIQGVPGIYYHSLLGSRNWQQGVEESGIPRKINREKLKLEEVEQELDNRGTLRSQVFGGYLKMLQARSREAAFSPEASQTILDCGPAIFALTRYHRETDSRILALINVTGDSVAIGRAVCGEDILCKDKRRRAEILEAYEVLWLRPTGKEED